MIKFKKSDFMNKYFDRNIVNTIENKEINLLNFFKNQEYYILNDKNIFKFLLDNINENNYYQLSEKSKKFLKFEFLNYFLKKNKRLYYITDELPFFLEITEFEDYKKHIKEFLVFSNYKNKNLNEVLNELKLESIKNNINLYKRKYFYYPLKNQLYRDKNNKLPRSFMGKKLDSNEDIRYFMNKLYKDENKFEKLFIENELINIFDKENHKYITLSQIRNNENNNRKIMLLLYEYFKYKHKRYPNVNDYEKYNYFPFIVGINKNKKYLLEYEYLFQENEIFKIYEQNELKEIFKNFDLKFIDLKKQNNKNKKVALKAEEIIFKLINFIISDFNHTELNKNNIELLIGDNQDKFFNKFKHIFPTNLYNEFTNNKKQFYYDVKNILNILIKEYQNIKLENLNFKNLNDEEMNSKGYDFIFKYENKNTLLSYKFGTGRSISNLSINTFFNKEIEYQNDENSKFINKIDNFIYTNYLKNIYSNILDEVFEYIKNDKNINIENPSEYVYKVIGIFYEVKSYDYTKLKSPLQGINFLDITEKAKLDTAIFKNIIVNSLYRVISDNNIENIKELKNKLDFINIETQKHIQQKHKNILLNSFFKNNESKKIYKYIIKNIYRNEEILEEIKEFLNLKINIKEELNNKVTPLFEKEFEKLKIKIKEDKNYKIEFLKYILHLKNKSSTYVIGNSTFYKNLKGEILIKNIEDINIDFKNLNSKNGSIFFDFNIKLKDKNIYQFFNNSIKSKDGNFMYLNSVEISTKYDINLNLIEELNKKEEQNLNIN